MSKSYIPNKPKISIPPNKYFVKKGFCILTKKVSASVELNKINIYLRKCALTGNLYANFEEYVARILF